MEELPWFLKETLSQLEMLVARRRIDSYMEARSGAKAPGASEEVPWMNPSVKPEHALQFVQFASPQMKLKNSDLEGSDVSSAMSLIQRWMRQFMQPEVLEPVVQFFVLLFKRYTEDPTVPKGKSRPSKKAVSSRTDELKEDSIAFFLLDTIYLMLRSAVEVQNDDAEIAFNILAKSNEGKKVEEFIDFLFDKLAYRYSPAVRQRASLCLSILTLKASFLKSIVSKFSHKMESSKRDSEVRVYAVFQRSLNDLAFGFSHDRQDITIDFLGRLCNRMKKIDRGILRQEVCLTLKEVFRKLLDPADEILLEELELMEKGPRALEFWDLYRDIYDTVAKWSAKPTHASFCYDVMSVMTCLGNREFYTSKDREDIIRLFLSGFKKEDLRLDCLGYCVSYIRDLNIFYIQEDSANFISQMKELTSGLFPKKKAPSKNEYEVYVTILVEIGKKHLDFVVNEVITEIIKPKSLYFEGQKYIALKALSHLAKIYPKEISSFDYSLAPILSSFIEVTSSENISIMRAAIPCFPYIKHPSVELSKSTAYRLSKLCLHRDREIAQFSSHGLQVYSLYEPQEFFVPSVYMLLELLYNIDLCPQDVLRIFNNLSYMYVSLAEHLLNNPELLFRKREWVALRQHVEGVCLAWFCHPETWLRREVFRLLEVFRIPSLKNIEVNAVDETIDSRHFFASESWNSSMSDKIKHDEYLFILLGSLDQQFQWHNIPYLANYIDDLKMFIDGDSFDDRAFISKLQSFLSKNADSFSGPISLSWKILCPSIHHFARVINNETIEADAFKLLLLRVKFLCSSLIPVYYLDCVRNRSMPMQKYVHIYESLSVEYKSIRPCLTSLVIDERYVEDEFLTIIFQILHKIESRELFLELCESASLMPASSSEFVVRKLRSFIHKHSEMLLKKKKNKQSELHPLSLYFTHKNTLEFLDFVLRNTSFDESSNDSLVPLLLAELYQHWNENVEQICKLPVMVKKSIFQLMKKFLQCWNVGVSFDSIRLASPNIESPDDFSLSDSVEMDASRQFSLKSNANTSRPSHSQASYVYGNEATIIETRPFGKKYVQEFFSFIKIVYESLRISLLSPGAYASVNNHRVEQTSDQVVSKSVCQAEAFGCECLAELLNMGVISDVNLERNVISFLEQIMESGNHIRIEVSEALTNFLKNNRTLIREFMRKSLVESHQLVPDQSSINDTNEIRKMTQAGNPSKLNESFSRSSDHRKSLNPNRTMIRKDSYSGQMKSEVVTDPYRKAKRIEDIYCSNDKSQYKAYVYVKAVVENLCLDTNEWCKLLGSVAILLYSLIHQCSESFDIRILAVKLSIALSSPHVDSRFEVPYPRPLFSHSSPHMYVHEVIRYSTSLSLEYWQFLSDLLSESTFITRVMSTRNKEVLLRLLNPWMKTFPKFVENEYAHRSDKEAFQNISLILTSLFEITRLCVVSPTLSYLLNDIWVATLSECDNNPQVITDMIMFFLQQYQDSKELGYPGVCKTILVHLVRSNNSSKLVKELMNYYPVFNEKVPLGPKEYLHWKTTREISWNSLTKNPSITCHGSPEKLRLMQESAFELTADLLYEVGSLFQPFFPLILHNVYTRFIHESPKTSREMLSFIALRLNLSISDSYDFTYLASKLKESSDPQLIDVTQEWASISFRWFIQSPDLSTSLRSFFIFRYLDQRISSHTLVILINELYISLVDQNEKLTTELLQIFSSIPQVDRPEPLVWILTFATSFCFLNFTRRQLFEPAISIFSKVLTANQESSSILVGSLHRLLLGKLILNDEPLNEEETVGAGVVSVLFKGLLQNNSFDITLITCIRLGSMLVSSSESKSTKRIIQLVLIAALLKLSLCFENVKTSAFVFLTQDHSDFDEVLALLRRFKEFDSLTETILEFHKQLYSFIESRRAVFQIANAKAYLKDESTVSNSHSECAVFVDLVKEGIASCFQSIHLTFSDHSDFNFIFEILLQFLKLGEFQWRKGVLWMFGVFLAQSSFKCDSTQFSDVSDLLIQNYYSTNDSLSETAEHVTTFILQSAPLDVEENKFNFLRKRVTRGRPVLTEQKASEDSDIKAIAERDVVLSKFESFLFGILCHTSFDQSS